MSVGLVAPPRLGTSSAEGWAVGASAVPQALVAAEERTHPWKLGDLRRLVRVLALSGTGLVLAWLVASGTTDPARQEYAVAGGIVACAVAVAGFAGWLLAGMRAVRELRDGAVPQMRALLAARAGLPPAPAAEGVFLTAPGMTHYHHATCVMVRGKAARAVPGARRAALAACPVCLPGEPS